MNAPAELPAPQPPAPQPLDGPEPRRFPAWKVLLAFGMLVLLEKFAAPTTTADAVLYLGLAFVSVVAVVAGAIRNRANRPLPWCLFAVALTLFLVGDLFFYYYDVVLGIDRPFPSLADGLYLASYPFMIAGTMVLIRRRGRGGPAALIDSSIIAVGLGVLFWVFVIEPVASQSGIPMIDRLISTAYPVMDVLLLVAAARLAVTSFGRRPAYSLLGLGVAGLLAADAFSGVIQLSHTFHVGTLVDTGWMCFYLFWGVSALHPSVRALDAPEAEQPAETHWTRLIVLAAACLLAPGVLAVRWINGTPEQSVVMLASSMVLFVLALARMHVLTRALASTAARERSLRNSAASFVTATDGDGVRVAAIAAARAVVGRSDAVFALAAVEGDATFVLAYDGAADLSTSIANRRGPALFESLEASALQIIDASPKHVLSVALQAPSGLRGVLVVGAPTRFAAGLGTVLETLGSQVALALESAALTADLLRRKGELRFRSLVQNSFDLITVVDCDSIITYQSPSVTQVLGHDDTTLLGASLLDLVHPDDVSQTVAFLDRVTNRPGSTVTIAHRLHCRNGAWANTETVGSNLLDDASVHGIVLTTRDVSERLAFEDQLHHQAFHDALTGLANRRMFADRVQNALSQRNLAGGPVGVIFLDLDDYKAVNDSLGHHAGDELLIAVAARLDKCVRPGDTTARFGGDEFAVLLPGMAGRHVAVNVANRVIGALDEGFVLDGKKVFVGASIGIAFADGTDDDGGDLGHDDLLRNADVAMYTAKSRGKGCFAVFEPGMHSAVLNRLQLKADLQRALDQGEFEVHFQPIMSVETGRMTGVEALVRWKSAERGLVPPDQFIPLCEETGLILPLGRWVLDAALHRAAGWSFAERSMTMSVNLSAMQLQQPRFAAEVALALANAGVDPHVLTLELTESMLMGDVGASVAVLHELRALGVRLVIDDFGTGYSSLSYLRQLPIDGLKIDKEFVHGIQYGRNDSLLLGTVIDLARSLDLETTAEGVEFQEQLEKLQELGCDLAQGFLFARPLDADQLEQLLPAMTVAGR